MARVSRRILASIPVLLLAVALAALTQGTSVPRDERTLDGDPATGTPIQVTVTNEPAGVDIALAGLPPCVPSPTRLCLLDQRFQVEVVWRSSTAQGLGQAHPLTDDAGTFWFFHEDNVELVVKVLDACELDPFNSVWVFAAGLTNVEVRLRVEDTVTGELREYLNPLHTPYAPVQDTEAFDVCF